MDDLTRRRLDSRARHPSTWADPVDTATVIGVLHPACLVLVDADSTADERRDALLDLLPYVTRGDDIAWLLGVPE